MVGNYSLYTASDLEAWVTLDSFNKNGAQTEPTIPNIRQTTPIAGNPPNDKAIPANAGPIVDPN